MEMMGNAPVWSEKIVSVGVYHRNTLCVFWINVGAGSVDVCGWVDRMF